MNTPTAIIGKDFVKQVIPLIDAAAQSISIIVYDWRFYLNDPASPVSLFNQAIRRAASRGVTVRVLVQHQGTIDRLREIGCIAKRIETVKLLHTKMMILDDQFVLIGSHNYTQNAFSVNEEASVFIDMGTKDHKLRDYFNNLWGV